MFNLHILADAYCYQFRDKIHNYKECSFFEGIAEDERNLKEKLSEEDKKLVDIFKCGIINCHEERDFYNIADALNFGVKLGMELQEYFHSLLE